MRTIPLQKLRSVSARPTIAAGACRMAAAVIAGLSMSLGGASVRAEPAASEPASSPNPAPASSENAPTAPPAKPLDVEMTPAAIQQRLEQIKASKDLDEAAKSTITDLYQKALQELDRAEKLTALAAQFDQLAQSAPKRLQEARQELEQPASKARVGASPGISLAQMETELAQAQTDLANAQDKLTEFDAEPKKRAERRLEIPKKMEEFGKQLLDLQKSLDAPPAENESAEIAAARKTMLRARKAAKEKELAELKSERESYTAEDEWLPKRRAVAEREVTEKKALVESWQELIHERREKDAAETLKQAVREKKDTCPELQGIASENEELAKRAKTVSDNIAAAEHHITEFKAAFADLDRDFKDLKSKYEILQATPEIGPFLLQYRAELRRQRQRLEKVRSSESTVEEAHREFLTLLDQRKKLNDIQGRAKEIIRTLDLSGPHPPSREELDYDLRELLGNRCDLLDSLSSASTRYLGTRTDLAHEEEKLAGEIERESEYIDERILWVRSASVLAPSDFSVAAENLRWYSRPSEWAAAAGLFGSELLSHLFSTFAAAAGFLVLLAGQRKMRAKIRELGEQAGRGSTTIMAPTLRVLALTVLLSLPWPLLLVYIGWRLGDTAPATELTLALASGFQTTGLLLLPLELFRHVCRGSGLGQAHFGWSQQSLRLIRKHLRWFMLIGLPLTFAAAATHALENDRWRDSLGRILFITAMLLLAIFSHRVFRPVCGILQSFLSGRGTWPERLNYAIFPLAVGGPAALAVLAGLGYFYTAEQLAARLQATAWLLVGLLIAGALALRWVLVSRRRLAVQQARQRRAAALAAAQAAESNDAPTLPASPDDALDLTVVNAQTRHIVQMAVVAALAVGLWGIWADVLPALSIFDRQLWTTTGADDVVVPVKVSHLLMAIVSFAMMLIAGRNIPGLLEIAILQRLPLEPATRYAITTLSRYAITMMGVVLICGTLGVTWDKVHWLVAAVSVGLGFGLQEIFANFISGLIILFERPIRVGDIVTVDDVSGIVSRIRIRATVIVDWDRKELIVPNKEFITGRVLNWTLTDQMNRVVVNVGVAYGSDVSRVRELLLKIAAENEFILRDPAPMACFDGFGDSSLNFVLRCYLPNLENRLAVTHDLHANIHNAFQSEGIEIPFPQRDLNVRYLDAAHSGTLPLAMKKADGAPLQQKKA